MKPSIKHNRADHNPNTLELSSQIKNAWLEVLKLEHITENSNFFKCGGDSLSAIILMAKIEEITGCLLDDLILFENPTFSDFASEIKERLGGADTA